MLYFKVKKIFKTLNGYARIGVNVLVRLLLGLAYLVLLFPFGVIARLCADYLEIKKKSPSWNNRQATENEKEFLAHQ